MTKMLVGIWGAGGCGRGILPVVREQLQNDKLTELVFIDDKPPQPLVNGSRCIKYEEFLADTTKTKSVVLAVADPNTRAALAGRCNDDGVGFFEVRAKNSLLMDDVKIGVGAVISPFVTITSNITIGCHFHANLYSYVEHDCVIGDYVTFAPSVCCNGNVQIGDYAYIGSGAVIKQGIQGKKLTIGKGAIIGMGAVVTMDVPEGMTVVGNPARQLVKG